ncbi:membrane-bound lytic murein transglycosylase D [Chitinophaga terrae (ex Kim and Jung 2007)]|uniref:Membrane-bound lytic murein transglycosylase D n=1 Tax=Chitinophaga terrae (ex Kim and Jung 2007) TaxID=408074 RepID=A0A1H3YA73_9BACT|nr:lytic transglycosylase domain-containing protein [Chitinophaga terrae (ex Kim and Jung 2007)]MDQ0107928.1 membrane-bound lytic murein transglycosylase D [Chitinophaga terrae (ex Kim and Jung 2007)]SEA08436.1 membrane-bound lytic murein transglycosylase D [Chitinophaga terrae (ex Kim and Jung 2007)]
MRKIFLLLLLPATSLVYVSARGGISNPKEMVYSAVAPDTTVLKLNHKVHLPKDTVAASPTSVAVRKAAQSLPNTIRSPKVYEQINNNLVASYVNNYATRYSQHLQIMVDRGQPYFNMIEKVFRDNGIPEEMKYLAVIESSFNTNARSRVGAVGAWQFMAGTARIFGLNVGKKVDERKDFYKSTIAAAQFLNQLYAQFGDWLLVVAAYNCGPGGVQRAINASGRTDFWGMQYFLPAESRNHVYKFIATGYILDRFNNFFGVSDDDDNTNKTITVNMPAEERITRAPLSEEEIFNTVEINITGKYRLEAIAKKLDMPVSELDRLNPGFAKAMSSAENSYDLRVPKTKMKEFMAEKEEMLKESVQMTLDDKAVGLDKSKFPPPVKMAEKNTAAPKVPAKRTTSYKKKTSTSKKHASTKHVAAKKKTTHKKA